MRHNIDSISAAKSRLLLLGQCHCLHRSSAGPTTAAFFNFLNFPTFSRNLAQYRPYSKPIVIFTMASSSESRRARVGLMDGTLLGHVSLLPWQTILEVRKPEFGTALARCCTENKCRRPEFGPELAANCIPELSFQQRHDIAPKKIPCTRVLFCIVRTGTNFAILVEMTKFKFSKKNKESKLI